MSESISGSWPQASSFAPTGVDWPTGVVSVTYTRTLSYREERLVDPFEGGDCAGQTSLTEYYTHDFTETVTFARTDTPTEEHPFIKPFKTLIDAAFAFQGEWGNLGCATFPQGHPVGLGYSAYPSIGNYKVQGDNIGTKTGAWTRGTAACVYHEELTPPRWVFQLNETSGSLDDDDVSFSLPLNRIVRKWFHDKWCFVYTHERLATADKNWATGHFSAGPTKAFTLTQPPDADPGNEYEWHYASYSEVVTITLNTA